MVMVMKPAALIFAATLSGLALATDVSVQHDATYSIDASRGPICSGAGAAPAGTACPLRGDIATAACIPGLPSYTKSGCMAPIDAQCAIVTGTTWGCVFPSGGFHGEEVTPCPSLSVASEVDEDIPCPRLPFAYDAVDTPCPSLQLPSESGASAVYSGKHSQPSGAGSSHQGQTSPTSSGGTNGGGHENYSTGQVNSGEGSHALEAGSHGYYAHEGMEKEKGDYAAGEHNDSNNNYTGQGMNEIQDHYAAGQGGSGQLLDGSHDKHGVGQGGNDYKHEHGVEDSYGANNHDVLSGDRSRNSYAVDQNGGSHDNYAVEQGDGSQEDCSGQDNGSSESIDTDLLSGVGKQDEGGRKEYFAHQDGASLAATDHFDVEQIHDWSQAYSADTSSTADQGSETHDSYAAGKLHEAQQEDSDNEVPSATD